MRLFVTYESPLNTGKHGPNPWLWLDVPELHPSCDVQCPSLFSRTFSSESIERPAA